MIENLKLNVGWNPSVGKYQAVASYMIVSKLETFSRNDEQETPGTYQGSKSMLMQKHLEAVDLNELVEKLKKLED